MPDFTPSPWVVDVWGGGIFSRSADCSIVDLAEANSDKEKFANARLIAAAPDLYEALKECYDFIEDIICHDCEYCSRSLDAEGLRIALDDLFSSIDRSEDKGHDTHA